MAMMGEFTTEISNCLFSFFLLESQLLHIYQYAT